MSQSGSWSTQSLLEDPDLSYLKQLTSPSDSKVDIVAVHGLHVPVSIKPWKDPQSFGARTWVAGSPGEEKLWLKDFLPDDIPEARVFLFGYNSNVGLDTSSAGTSGAADDLLTKLRDARRGDPERPLLFLCHSLGGIVAKQAVSRARSNLKYQELFRSVRAMAFFATPHRGGLAAEEGRVAAGALRRFTGNVRSSIMEALLPDSFYSFDIHQAFLDSLDQIRVCTFYELKPMPSLRQLVVSRNSAVLGLPYPNEDKIPVPESNHSTICKFPSRTQNYGLVIRAIADLVEWSLKPTPQTSRASLSVSSTTSDDLSNDKPPPYSSLQEPVPPSQSLESLSLDEAIPRFKITRKPLATDRKFPKGPFYLLPSITGRGFVGRKTTLNLIKELLASSNEQQQSNVALYGLGGVGKTQVALQILSWYRSEFPDRSIFWIQAGSADLMRQSLTDLGIHCGVIGKEPTGQPLDLVRQFLQDPKHGRWLVFVDNADTLDPLSSSGRPDTDRQYKLSLRVMLAYHVPKCLHGTILYTTRSKAIGEKLTNSGHVIEIGPLEHRESHELLRGQMQTSSQSLKSPLLHQKEAPTDEALETLSNLLNHVPLALSQAAAFMRQQNVAISEYLRLIEQDTSRLAYVLENDFLTMSSDSEWSKAVTSVWSLSFNQIEASVPEAADLLSFMAFLGFQNIPKFILQYLIPDEWTLTATALGTLQSYSLVNAGSEPETFNMHLLVQLATRIRLASAGSAGRWISRTLELLSDRFPQGGYDVWPTSAALLPHALQALQHSSTQSEDILPAKAIAELQAKISVYYFQQWLFPQALELSEKALESSYAKTKAAKAFVLEVKDTQVWTVKSLGRLEEAELLAKEAWLERQHLLGAKHVDTLNSLKTLSLAYQEQGKFDEAAKAARTALKSLQKTQPEDDQSVLDMKRRLASVLYMTGELDEAEKMIREAFEWASRRLGPEDIATLKYKWHLARVLHGKGQYAEAERLNRETWDTQTRVLGENSLEPLKTLFSLAVNLQALGQAEAALGYARKVHERAVDTLGLENPYTWHAAANLAACLLASDPAGEDAGKLAEAAALYQRVLASREARLRTDHPDVLSARTDVSTAMRLGGDPEGAEKLGRETLKRLDAALGAMHPLALASREGLARALWAQREGERGKDKGKEGIEQARKVLKSREKKIGWQHPDTRRTAELLIGMLADGKEKERLGRRVAEKKGSPSH